MLLSSGQLRDLDAVIHVAELKVDFRALGIYGVDIVRSTKGHLLLPINRWPEQAPDGTDPKEKHAEIDIWAADPAEKQTAPSIMRRTQRRQPGRWQKEAEAQLDKATQALP